jgi:hypothetical protein
MMRKIIFFILIGMVCTTGFSENPRWKEVGTPIPARADLDVRWDAPTNSGVGSNVPTNAWPSKMFVYYIVSTKFSPKAISHLMVMCSLTEKDKSQQDTNGVVFKSSDGSRTLSISFSSGSIRYETPQPHYGPTNLAEGVPPMSQMSELTKDFLKEIDIKLSEIEKNSNGIPNFHFWEPFTEYYVKGASITNIEFRAVVFSRSVDGAQVVGDAGHCGLEFGERGKISQIHLSWPNLKRNKSSATLTPQTIMQLLREGKAHLGLLPMGFGDIDWQTVKGVIIKQAWPCYFAGNSDTLYPFLTLWTTIETGHGNVDVEIDCPIIDEAETSAAK